MTDVPTFNVLAFGMQGSGKTVFLASMYHRMLAYSEKRGFFLSCRNERDNSELLSTFEDVAAAHKDFPLATNSLTEYVFECRHRTGKGSIKICEFKYVDFPGGFLVGKGAYEDFRLLERAREAHSILVLLDGKKIKDELDGVQSRQSIQMDVLKMASTLQECVGLGKTIHFLVTKADLLDPAVHTMARIQDYLFQIQPFKEIITQQCNFSIVHMVPVSAVGPGFCRPDPATGEMVKLPGAQVRPFNVELSVALTFYDHLLLIQRELEPKLRRRISRGERTIGLLEAFRKGAQTAETWSPVYTLLGWSGLDPRVVSAAFRRFDDALLKRRGRIEAELRKLLAETQDAKSAFAAVCAVQNLAIQRFEQLLPDSNVGRRLGLAR